MGCKISFHGPYVVQALSTLMSQEESFLLLLPGFAVPICTKRTITGIYTFCFKALASGFLL